MDSPDDLHVILAAPTGTAAHNISGVTLHAAFLLPLGQTKSYIKLSDDKRNSLRAKLKNLKILIIDEISMVGMDLLLQLHYRLCELTGILETFGGVSLLAFGDLFQLPPVLQHFVFKSPRDPLLALHGSLWSDSKCIELTQIMRQKEYLQFASLLNRIRTGSHSEEDIDLIKTRCISEDSLQYPHNALHVYATNAKVDEHNIKKLNALKCPIINLQAIDKVPSVIKSYSPSKDIRFTGGLPNEVDVAEGARVMLIRNLDVSDGLVNGAQGVITGFITRPKDLFIVAILVNFDDCKTGNIARQKTHFSTMQLKNATPICRSEISYTVSNKSKSLSVTRQQFPIKLCWTCTIHKVQGITLNNIVVSFDNRFNHGQAYVALSRSRTLNGLYILNFDDKKITANSSVIKEMERMRKECVVKLDCPELVKGENDLTVALLNVRSLIKHDDDVACSLVTSKTDILILTETWL
ncbi:ATP-dependent DNA helicase PIF1-like [Argopecten irradians]|uniref:ATP-dependent DNA helicase PIF1-like n=1 Tax=Argopecten irradians TaxID=31199 RepID=UPI00371699FE